MGAIVFVASFAIYAAFAAPALGWLDSAEFVAAAATLGVPHSPGHPLQALLSNLATFVPVGDVAIRVNLLSSACMATANLLLYRGLVELGQWQADGVSARWLEVGAGALTLSLGLAAPLWVQAGRAEVYALHTALLTGALWTAIRYLRADRSSDLIAFGLISGLALATHHFIALTLLVPCTAVVLWARKKDGSATAWVLRPSVRGLAMAVPAGALGLVAFAYLPLRAARDPLLNWGNPDTLGRLWWTISGRAFSGSLVDDHSSSLTTDLMQVLAATLISAPALLVLSLLGIYAALRLGKERALLATCVATVGLVIVGRALLGFDPETPDHYAYLIPALLALTVLASIGLFRLQVALGDQVKRVTGVVAAVAMALTIPMIDGARVDQRGAYAADEIARLTIDSAPPRALVMTSYFQTAFRTLAIHTAEGARPDLILIDRSFLSYPGEREAVLARHPELWPVIEAGLEPGQPMPVAELQALAADRPILIELHFNLGRDYHRALGKAGPFAWLGRAPADESGYHRSLNRVLASASGADREWAQLHILWTDYVHLLHACERGTIAEAARVYRRTREYAAGDTMLEDLARQCGLKDSR